MIIIALGTIYACSIYKVCTRLNVWGYCLISLQLGLIYLIMFAFFILFYFPSLR